MQAIIHTYEEAYIINVAIRYDGSCRISNEFEYHIRDVINKMACFNPYSDFDLASELYSNTDAQSVSPGSKLFIAKECKTQRDIFRNSGYSIKLNPNDANVIVVPDIVPKHYHTSTCNLVAMSNDDKYLFLVSIQKAGRSIGDNVTAEDVELVKNYLAALRNYKFDDTRLTSIEVWFIPKCKELKDVMLDTKECPLTPYIQESLIPINASTNINPETLLYWKNIAKQDQELLARTICTSNWRKYPFTVLCFLKTFDVNWNIYGNNDFKNLLRVIGYSPYSSLKYLIGEINIKPEDYDMFQSYIYYLLGLDPEKGGVVTDKALSSIKDYCSSDIKNELLYILQNRYAFKPFHLSGTMSGKTVMEILQ